MTKTYIKALAAHNAAFHKFYCVRDIYRARAVGNYEFLAAKAEFAAATKLYDAAFAAEQKRIANKANQPGENEMTTATDFRIEQIQKATVNGRAVKMFTAFKKQGDAFVHIGKFSAPVKTANKNLWQIAAAQ